MLFGSPIEPVLLTGGQGQTLRSGEIVLKPVSNQLEAEELGKMLEGIEPGANVRIPRQLKSTNAKWIEHGYVAWEYLPGKEETARYREKMQICDHFSEAFAHIDRPDFLDRRTNPWAIADRVCWGEMDKEYPAPFQQMKETILSSLPSLRLPNQIIHGDIAGNILFSESNPPAVIDLTIYWRPKDFAKALLLVDAITWEDASTDISELVRGLPEIEQLILRAGLRRMLEYVEQLPYRKSMANAVADSRKYFSTLELLGLL